MGGGLIRLVGWDVVENISEARGSGNELKEEWE
jgi:hypothetical protein